MKAQPTIVRLIKTYGNKYDLKFPELDLEITVGQNIYTKMSNTPDHYKFLVYPYN